MNGVLQFNTHVYIVCWLLRICIMHRHLCNGKGEILMCDIFDFINGIANDTSSSNLSTDCCDFYLIFFKFAMRQAFKIMSTHFICVLVLHYPAHLSDVYK